jgi:hypothetical protein
MRLDNRKPGTSTTFMDAGTGEDIFQVASDENGLVFMSYHLYDAKGSFVAESAGLGQFPAGLKVKCSGGETLLDFPADSAGAVHYRLYNNTGRLLTTSDGAHTKIYPLLQMQGVGRLWALPVPEGEAVAAPASQRARVRAPAAKSR